MRARFRSEDGSILVQVAIGLFALMAMTTFVFDWGVMWVARRQAQNAADSGALSAAVALAFDDDAFDDDSLKARQSAIAVASSNYIWGETPTAGALTNDPANTVNAYTLKCPDGTDTCVRVDVYRNVDKGNPLPMFFGQLVGLTDQGVQATATAQAAVSDWAERLRPWAVPDLWEEHCDPDTGVDHNRRAVYGVDSFNDDPADCMGHPDIYRPPSDDSPTGYNLDDDEGTDIVLHPNDSGDAIVPGNYFIIALDGTGGSTYEENIINGADVPAHVGTTWEQTTEPGKKVGPTFHGLEELCAKPADQHIVPIPVFDPSEALKSGRTEFLITNILGLEIQCPPDMHGDVIGRFVSMPGILRGSGPPDVNPSAAFLKVPILVK